MSKTFPSVFGDACKGILTVREEDGIIYQNELINSEYLWVAYNQDGSHASDVVISGQPPLPLHKTVTDPKDLWASIDKPLEVQNL